jgi:hypothetical protein
MLAANQSYYLLKAGLVGSIEIVQLISVDIQNQAGSALLDQRHDSFRFGQVAAGDVAWKCFDILHQNGILSSGRGAAHPFVKRDDHTGERPLKRAEREKARRCGSVKPTQ